MSTVNSPQQCGGREAGGEHKRTAKEVAAALMGLLNNTFAWS